MRRSSSPSTPSEGEIIESGSETKATTSQTSVNSTNVNRNTRITISAPRSPAPVTRSPRRQRTRSRSRSRSPYRSQRGEKRTREDDYDSERGGRPAPRWLDSRHEGRYSDRGPPHRRQRSYYDYDRNDNYSDNLRYGGDDYDRRQEKRPRTRSRSPYYGSRRQKQYSGDERESRNQGGPASKYPNSRRYEGRRSSTEQSVSERGNPPVVARNSRQEAEIGRHQVQQDSNNTNSGTLDRYVDSIYKNSEANGLCRSVDSKTAHEPLGPVDEASLIEERRRRREAIKAKYRGPGTPLLVQALHIGNETKTSTPVDDTSSPNNMTPGKYFIPPPEKMLLILISSQILQDSPLP